jgi:eight-cysteine-cluster-containing protein
MFALKEALYVLSISFLVILTLLISGGIQTSTSAYTKNTSNLNLPQQNQTYYGFSTFGYCNTSKDCIISGCNKEICQSRYEEGRVSICIVPNKPTPLQLGYSCECISNKCEWAK